MKAVIDSLSIAINRVNKKFSEYKKRINKKTKGALKMTVKKKNGIWRLRSQGLSYSEIAGKTRFSENTIKLFVRKESF